MSRRIESCQFLKEAEETLAAGYISWRKTDLFNQLYACNDHANKIFLYILRICSIGEKRPIPSKEQLAQILCVCDNMANAAGRKQSPSIKNLPKIESFPSIQSEIFHLQKSLQMNTR